MSLESVGNWFGAMVDIGPLYPWVGLEWLLALVCLIVWLGWHVWQIRMEESNYADDMNTLKQGDNMERVLKGEKLLRPL